MKRILLWTILALAPAASAGPLPFTNIFVPALPFLHLVPTGTDVLPQSSYRIELSHTISNTWAHSRVLEPIFDDRPTRAPATLEELQNLVDGDGSNGLFHFDAEMQYTTLAFSRGLGRGLEVGLRVPWIRLGGGFLDDGIERFHAASTFDRAGRRGIDLDAYTLYLRVDGQFELFENDPPPAGLGDVTLELKSHLASPASWTLAGRTVVKLPTGDRRRRYGSGNPDYAVELLASRPLGAARLHLGVAAVRLGESAELRLAAQTTWSSFVAYDRPLGERWRLVGQLAAWESPFVAYDLKELSRDAFMFQGGASRSLAHGRELIFGVSDNNFTFQSSADIGLHLTLRQDLSH